MKKNINTRIKNFYKRWNIVYDENKKISDFKNRVLLTIDIDMGKLFISDRNLEQRSLKFMAKYIPQSKKYIDGSLGPMLQLRSALETKVIEFKDSPIYKILSEENDFEKFILFLQSIFWLDLDSEVKEELYLGFKEEMKLSMLDIRIGKTSSGIIFYPKGAKLLDEKLVNENLDWLTSYPTAYENFKSALEKHQNKIYQRNLIDDLRLSLELILKRILNNKGRLEKQEKLLGEYLEREKVPKELRNMYWQLIDYYTKYQNNYAKHDDKVNSSEVEFMIYLTGTFIRFLMTLEDRKNDQE